MAAQLPECSVCRVRLEPGTDVAFTPDGRVHHLQCPTITCPVCSCDILPDEPIRRDDDVPVHGGCWPRHERLRLGVTEGPDREQAEIIHARLASGALPSTEPTKAWGGTSTGAVCGACTMRIQAGSMEYEVEFAGTLLFRMHRACYQMWQEEYRSVRRPEISGGSAASPWTLIFHDGVARRAAAEASAHRDFMLATADTRSASAMLRRRSGAVRAATDRLLGVLPARSVAEE